MLRGEGVEKTTGENMTLFARRRAWNAKDALHLKQLATKSKSLRAMLIEQNLKRGASLVVFSGNNGQDTVERIYALNDLYGNKRFVIIFCRMFPFHTSV